MQILNSLNFRPCFGTESAVAILVVKVLLVVSPISIYEGGISHVLPTRSKGACTHCGDTMDPVPLLSTQLAAMAKVPLACLLSIGMSAAFRPG